MSYAPMLFLVALKPRKVGCFSNRHVLAMRAATLHRTPSNPEKRKLTIHACEDIKEGDEISIPYLDLISPDNELEGPLRF